MSLLRYSPRRRHEQCYGNADDGEGKVDPISLDLLEGRVVKLGQVCFDPLLLSRSLRTFKRDPVTNEYVLLDVRNRVHGFANQPPEDIDVLEMATIFVRDHVHGEGERIRREVERMDRDLNDVAGFFHDDFFTTAAINMVEGSESQGAALRKYLILEINSVAKSRGVLRAMLKFEKKTRHRAATRAETRAFGKKIFRLRHEANKTLRSAMRLGMSIQFKDPRERDSVRRRLAESEQFIESAERIGYV